MKVLLIDFYDSFTYNIYHYLVSLGAEVLVVEERALNLKDADDFEMIVFSPGPGLPSDTSTMKNVLDRYRSTKKILGICLGMQGIAEYFGASLYNMKNVKHGVAESMNILAASVVFKEMDAVQQVGLYHSWAVDLTQTQALTKTAVLSDSTIMAFEHKEWQIIGLQFHPESILTTNGKKMLENVLFSK